LSSFPPLPKPIAGQLHPLCRIYRSRPPCQKAVEVTGL
jgi:hypothetical protein